ncbi:hypothetical protein LOZ16_005204 [Ophidiomyces ophidiicola]|nr:hypothetical protein LOZ16_005204 [Ophidiomyces ophidiicola]
MPGMGTMNQHPPPPHGQSPAPPHRRQAEIPYTSGPPNARSSQAFTGYHPHAHTHATGPLPPYTPHQYQPHWYSYPQMPHPPHPIPPQPYQSYSPLIVSSYPRSQHIAATLPPHSLPQHPTTSTPQAASFTSTPPPLSAVSAPVKSDAKEDAPRVQQLEVQVKGSDTSADSSPLTPCSNSQPPEVKKQTKEQQPTKAPFKPPLPWLSVPEAPFPRRLPRRRKPGFSQITQQSVALSFKVENDVNGPKPTTLALVEDFTAATPTTSHPTSEPASTQPTSPSTSVSVHTPLHGRQSSQSTTSRHIAPIIPIIPILPPSPVVHKQSPQKIEKVSESAKANGQVSADSLSEPAEDLSVKQDVKPAPISRPPPKSWADLVRTTKPSTASNSVLPSSGVVGALGSTKNESLSDVINDLGSSELEFYSSSNNMVTFFEPRGLVNTGNMCYMNSILQVLVFCVPFYNFLDRISRRAAHAFKSELPLLDAMIMFMREFRVIDSAVSTEQLRLRLKPNELEQFGPSLIPEHVYQVIRHLPRFRDMRRGHQQDAQEFLGFLFEELHEECLLAVKSSNTPSDVPTPSDLDDLSITNTSEGWLEVGHKQKPAVTRSSGHIATESPITKIFGGKIRSEFRVPRNKISVTLEPYQSLQLDIGSPQVNNIIDALKGLTRPETMHGDFSSSRGPRVSATKQIFIESLPPVLILHLKRFQYDNVTKGTQKIWKKVGYPLELEIPKEVFPQSRRNMFAAQGSGLPKYRLTGVIYHHGKSASGGHYTVELRRQDGREWIRIDDTEILRVRSDDVAFAGSEEDPKALAAALEQQKLASNGSQTNIFRHFDQDDDQDSDSGWNRVNGSGSGHGSKKSISSLANGTVSPTSGASTSKRIPGNRSATRENKVAYLLFYQQI